MNTASPRDVTRLLQTRGRGEKAVLEEHTYPVRGELCGPAPHPIGRKSLGPALPTATAGRAS